MQKFFDFTPDPKVLIALTHTSMLPLDALCELIDNSIDGFSAARIQGVPTEKPLIVIDLPSRKDIVDNTGILRIRDNGPGMTSQAAEKAIKAGFSGNNPYDNLGLFGMGFNISTGKFGRVTRFRTARKDNAFCTETTIDLEKINKSKDYRLPATEVDKPEGLASGTIIEVRNWWPDGNPNRGFVSKLVRYGERKIREEIGRRYTKILRSRDIQILVNGEKCTPFEHCIWGDERFVERKIGKIPAVYRFNEIVGHQQRCGECTALIPHGSAECPSCGSTRIRTIEERVEGWIGILRFDHDTNYGIDLIRNGRAIRIAEKSAFFEYVDDLKKITKDYPIDQQYGRIAGEVSLDFVPVDFLKQDFQRSSDEWQRAISFLRGESSLQPTQPNANQNNSVMYKLYQGYRRVRKFGKADMYMGYWDVDTEKPKRISRDIEEEYYQKFLDRIPGFYDDAEWWRKVEEAEEKPVPDLMNCPSCDGQNLVTSDVCCICGYILKGKTCIAEDCSEYLAESAQVCQACGTRQIPKIQKPWICDVCGNHNRAELSLCEQCERSKGTPNPLSEDYLQTISNKDDDLSLEGLSIKLANGSNSNPIDINVFVTSDPIASYLNDENLPLLSFKDISKINVYIDKTHRIFKTCHVHTQAMIAAEAAMFLYDMNRGLSNFKEHNLSSISWGIIENGWLDEIEDNQERIYVDIKSFLIHVKNRLTEVLGDDAEVMFDEMTEEQQKSMADGIISTGKGIAHISKMRQDGTFLKYIPSDFILDIFNYIPEKFFNGGVWNVDFGDKDSRIGAETKKHAKNRIKDDYENCLRNIIMFERYRSFEPLDIQRAKLALEKLGQKLVM